MGLTNCLNFGQTTIVIADQLVYTIAKQLQWHYPDQCKKMFIMVGPLHIEVIFMNVIEDWVKGSSWTDIFNRANIITAGRVESFLVGNKVKSALAHQVPLALLTSLTTEAFNLHNEELNF